jgi:hypothetical protein
METSKSDFSEGENEYNNNGTTFETNEESLKGTNKKEKFKKWINSDTNLTDISNIKNTENDSSSSSTEENNKNDNDDNNNTEKSEDDDESKETKEDSNNIKKNYIFIWDGSGNQVKITGSFCDWKIQFNMEKDPNDNCFKCQLPLDNKIYQFKFIVDNEWKYSPKYPIQEDNSGNTNNIIDLTNYKEIKEKKEINKKNNSKKILQQNKNKSEVNKQKIKIKRVDSIYSCEYLNEENLMPLPLPNKRYYQSFKLDKFTHQDNIGDIKFYNIKERIYFTCDTSSKTIFFLGHNNLNHLLSCKNKRMFNIKNCTSFRYRGKSCTFLYYK